MPVPFRKPKKHFQMARAYAWAIFVFGGRTLSVAYGDSSPEGRALGKEGNSRPYRSTTRRSQLISAKLFAPAKASPFRERWHGGAVTERVLPGRTPSVISLCEMPPPPKVEALAKRATLVLIGQRLGEMSPPEIHFVPKTPGGTGFLRQIFTFYFLDKSCFSPLCNCA